MSPTEVLDCEILITDFNRAYLFVKAPENCGKDPEEGNAPENRGTGPEEGRADYSGCPRLDAALFDDLRSFESEPERYGIRLFQALFPEGDLYKGYVETRGRAVNGKLDLRLRLNIGAERRLSSLHDLNWEYLFDPDAGGVAVARGGGIAFSRYLNLGQRPFGPVQGKLRILVAVSCPTGLTGKGPAPSAREAIQQGLQRAIEPLRNAENVMVEKDAVEVELLTAPVTARRINERLVEGRFHVLHLCAHGEVRNGLNDKPPQACLMLEKEDGTFDIVKEKRFAEVFEGQKNLRFVFLVACEGGRKPNTDPFSGVGRRLVRQYVPAVLAMRGEVAQEAADLFAKHFYRNLALTQQLDVAANYARRQIYLDSPKKTDWALPALYMRLRNGVIWQPPRPCPYVGLESFGEDDRDNFFGREKEVKRLLKRLEDGSVVVLGPSGSGKSSLVKAGVLPQLRQSGWTATVFRPGDDPLGQLATKLTLLHEGLSEDDGKSSELAGNQATDPTRVRQYLQTAVTGKRLLIVLDQFEEIFTGTSKQERRRFAQILRRLWEEPSVTLLLTLRDDFYAAVLSLDPLADLLEHPFNLRTMRRTELEETIRSPAQRVGLEIEKGLVEKILDDLCEEPAYGVGKETVDGGEGPAYEPGNLPLLQFALKELWGGDPAHRHLTHETYQSIGTVKSAIAQRATEIYASLSAEKQQALSQVLTRLVWPGRPEEGSQDARQRVKLSEIDPTLLEDFVRNRLLVTRRDRKTQEQTVELAHDALIRGWPRLQRLLDQNRKFLIWLDRLGQDKDEWLSEREEGSRLYRGRKLEQAQEWVSTHGEWLNDEERRFLQTAVEERERRRGAAAREEQERQRQRRVKRNWGFVATAAAAVLVTVLALWQQDSWKQAQIDSARELVQRSAESRRRPQRSLQLAVEASTLARRAGGRRVDVEEALLGALGAMGGQPLGPREPVLGAVLAPENRWLVTEPDDGRLRVLQLTGTWGVRDEFRPIEIGQRSLIKFSPDGSWMAVRGGNQPSQVWQLSWDGPKLAFETRVPARVVRFSRDGTGVAVVMQAHYRPEDGQTRGEEVSELQWWKLDETTSPATTFRLDQGTCDNPVWKLDVSSDHRFLVTAHRNGSAHLWEVEKEIPSCPTLPMAVHVHGAAFHPTRPWLAVATDEGLVLIRLRPGEATPEIVQELDLGAVESVTFSSKGSYLLATQAAAVAQPGKITVWNFDADKEELSLFRNDLPEDVEISPDERWLLRRKDNELRLWQLEASGTAVDLRGHDVDLSGWVVDPRDRWLLTWTREERARLWDLQSESPAAGPEPKVLWADTTVEEVSFLPGVHPPRLLAVGGKTLWQLAENGRSSLACPDQGSGLKEIAFSQDRTWVASLNARGMVCLWRLTPPRPIRVANFVLEEDPAEVSHLALSNDGAWLAWTTGSLASALPLGDDGQPGASLALEDHKQTIQGIAFDPKNPRLATAGDGEPAFLWDLVAGAQSQVLSPVNEGQLHAAFFAPAGSSFFSGGRADDGRLWQLAENTATLRFGPVSGVRAAAFSPAVKSQGVGGEARWLAIGDFDGWVHLWELTRQAETARPLYVSDHPVVDLAFSPNGIWLAAVGEGGTCRLWNLRDARKPSDPLTLPQVGGKIRRVTFSWDNRYLATVGSSGVLLWKVLDEPGGGLDELFELARETAGSNLPFTSSAR